jgi:hypothetical protein
LSLSGARGRIPRLRERDTQENNRSARPTSFPRRRLSSALAE